MATINAENGSHKKNIIDQLQETIPPIPLQDYIRDKKELGKEEFTKQYAKASGNQKEAEELAQEIYQEEDQE